MKKRSFRDYLLYVVISILWFFVSIPFALAFAFAQLPTFLSPISLPAIILLKITQFYENLGFQGNLVLFVLTIFLTVSVEMGIIILIHESYGFLKSKFPDVNKVILLILLFAFLLAIYMSISFYFALK